MCILQCYTVIIITRLGTYRRLGALYIELGRQVGTYLDIQIAHWLIHVACTKQAVEFVLAACLSKAFIHP